MAPSLLSIDSLSLFISRFFSLFAFTSTPYLLGAFYNPLRPFLCVREGGRKGSRVGGACGRFWQRVIEKSKTNICQYLERRAECWNKKRKKNLNEWKTRTPTPPQQQEKRAVEMKERERYVCSTPIHPLALSLSLSLSYFTFMIVVFTAVLCCCDKE